jgi:hypothetical protein
MIVFECSPIWFHPDEWQSLPGPGALRRFASACRSFCWLKGKIVVEQNT